VARRREGILLSFVYWSLLRLLELVVLRFRSEREKEIEILVLRHQLRVLERQVVRAIHTADRALLAAFSRVLPRATRKRSCSSRLRPFCVGTAAGRAWLDVSAAASGPARDTAADS
jgi:hypothetical protein